MEGYGRQFEQSSRMILMAFDAATTGRLALMEYKSLDTSRYLENIKKWHKECEWIHTKRKEGQSYKFLGMVGVKDIADILFGTESNGSLTIIDQNSKKIIFADQQASAALYLGCKTATVRFCFKSNFESVKSPGI